MCPPFPPGNLAGLPATIEYGTVRGSFYRCRNCGIGFRAPSLSEEQLRQVYRQMSSGQMAYPFETNGAWVQARRILIRRLRNIPSPKVLDVGCNEGVFLAGLPSSWQKCGLESSSEAARVAKNRGVQVIGEFLGDGKGDKESFDAVCMFDVFEHLPAPHLALGESLTYLKPNGLLLLSTADLESWTWRWLGARNWYLESPLHLSVLSRAFLEWFSIHYGAEVIKVAQISHRLGTFAQVVDDAVAIIHRGCQQRGRWLRLPQRIIQAYPRWRHLAHKKSCPFAPHVRDHTFVAMRKLASTPRLPQGAEQ
jgi:2-polyprenyl-3-methyl-5-hydroxy-6-metoxy-1,4-benzoquinol methylase